MRAFLILASLLTILPALAVADPSESDLMGQAQRAYLSGDLDNATHLFIQVVQMDGKNALAIQYLKKIRAALVAQQGTTDPIQNVVIPKIELSSATFAAALDYMKEQAAKQSVSISFVPELPAAQLQHPVTLSLSQIPFLDGLNYLCSLNNATYKLERYAIVILPATAANSAPPAAQ